MNNKTQHSARFPILSWSKQLGYECGSDVPEWATGISTDSRSISPGDIFIALQGARFDGHDYVDQAIERGALAVVCDRRFAPADDALKESIILCDDTLQALGDYAHLHRNTFCVPVIGIVGSNGKTTTKEMFASIARAHWAESQVCATQLNLNNRVGVPLTILRMTAHHKILIVECGTSKRGEMRKLGSMLRPTAAIMTSISEEHLDGLGDLNGVITEECSFLDGLASNGFVVIRSDDLPSLQRNLNPEIHVVTVGKGGMIPASYGPLQKEMHRTIEIQFPNSDPVTIDTPVAAEHLLSNAALSAVCAWECGVDARAIRHGLAAFVPASHRMEISSIGDALLVDDSYNANPGSMRSAITEVAKWRARGRIAVLGDMKELGMRSSDFHREIGVLLGLHGFAGVYAVGAYSSDVIHGYRSACADGISETGDFSGIRGFLTRLELEICIILLKGSRSMQMEKAIPILKSALQETRL